MSTSRKSLPNAEADAGTNNSGSDTAPTQAKPRRKPADYADPKAARVVVDTAASREAPGKAILARLPTEWKEGVGLALDEGAPGIEHWLSSVLDKQAAADRYRPAIEVAKAEAEEDARTLPDVIPLPNVGDPVKLGKFANFGPGKRALVSPEMNAQLRQLADGWPKRVEDRLFVPGDGDGPGYLDSASRLMAWIDRRAAVRWAKGGKFISQERFFEGVKLDAERFEAVEACPHWPPVPGRYYMHPAIPRPYGALGELIDRFRPSTPEDADLIRAMILTVFWGGPPGRRPAFLVTGPDADPEQGRGVGKSTLVDIIADDLAGGSVDVSASDPVSEIKTRLLSDGALLLRVVRLDNLKTLRFSWAELESLITDTRISGRRLYKGDGQRSNLLTWMITLNGASMSRDMAQRVVPIKLSRPAFAPNWEQVTRDFARVHRWEILADIGRLLDLPPGVMVAKTRWSTWEAAVLSKLDLAVECQTLILDRQSAIDDDTAEQDLVIDHFRAQLQRLGHDPDGGPFFLPSAVAAAWLNGANNTSIPTNRASAHLKTLAIPGLETGKKSGGTPGCRWSGREANPNAEATRIEDPDIERRRRGDRERPY